MQKEIQEHITQLIEKQKSLFLSTLDSTTDNRAENQTFSSYAPYAFDLVQKEFYVLLSDLAGHSQHLINNPQASILIIEDEAESEQIFARTRVQYQIQAEKIIDQEQQHRIYQQMKYRLGDILDVLTGLPDFHLFSLKPQNGRFVEGFGKAFKIDNGIADEIKPAMLK